MPSMKKKVRVELEDENGQQDPEVTEAATDSPPESQTSADLEAAERDVDPAESLQAAEQKAQEYYDRLLRVSAEFDNYKKRASREMRELVKFANEKFVLELLAVVDNLERAIESAPRVDGEDDPLLQGIDMTLNEVMKILERNHVKPVNALGEAFDPNFHQAMMQEESADQPANTVIREVQRGYTLHERLVRPAMVVVSKAKSDDKG